jgi:hypothetical protein
VDNYSIETEMDSAPIGTDGTVTSIHLGPDGMISSISQIFSSYTDCQSVLCKNCFWPNTGDCGMVYTPTSSANGLGFSLASTESSVVYRSAPYTRYGNGLLAQRSAYVQPFAWAYYVKGASTRLVKQAKDLDPPISMIGIGHDLRN